MNLEIKEKDGILIGYLSGYIDTATAVQVGKDIEPLMEQANRDIEIDCSNVFACSFPYARKWQLMAVR